LEASTTGLGLLAKLIPSISIPRFFRSHLSSTSLSRLTMRQRIRMKSETIGSNINAEDLQDGYPITIYWEDQSGREDFWTNHGRDSEDATGSRLATGVKIKHNGSFILFVYFNKEIIPEWSPWRWVHKSELLRKMLMFTPEVCEDKKIRPCWRWCLKYGDIQKALFSLFIYFYKVTRLCGDSLTATPLKFNKQIGVLPLSRLFDDDSKFASSYRLTEAERKSYQEHSSKYTKDWRQCSLEGLPSQD
jgi:hypothetical protein